MSSIKLSSKHGVNPTIPVCFFCGEEKNEIALLGRIGGKEDLDSHARESGISLELLIKMKIFNDMVEMLHK